ncbi:barstar family protein [Nakamurella aerolata]|uniref:barstar family protein n=1 Tax=Nakamurella aerolata TaxID=1656892 RepID=UPI001BB10451
MTTFLPADSAAALAERLGAVRVPAAPSTAASLAAFAAALHFPDYFGGNLDALLDCLRDRPATAPPLWWCDVARLRDADPSGYRAILRVFTDWQAERPAAGRTEVYVSDTGT